MSGDLISREALNDIWELYKQYQPRLATNVYEFGEALREFIDNAPTVDVVCPECYIRYSQGYIDGATNNPKECKACDYYKLAQSFINGIVEVISKNGLTSIDELLEILKREANKNE